MPELPGLRDHHRTDDALMFLGALLLFGLTAYLGPYPGEASGWVAALTGVEPFPPLTHPLYSLLARFVAAIPLGTASARLALFSALCGAAAVALLGRLVRSLPAIEPARPEDAAARRLGGWVAAFALAFAFPFWFTATRASSEPLALLLILAALNSLVRAERADRVAPLYAFAALYGMAVVEHPAALLFTLPVLLAAAVVALRRVAPAREGVFPDRVDWNRYLRLCLRIAPAALAGLLPLLLYAVWYARQPVAAWRGLDGTGAVALDLARAYARALAEVLPQVGWLLIMALAAAPCVYVGLVPFLMRKVWFVRPGAGFLGFALAVTATIMLLLDALAPAVAVPLLYARALPAAAVAFVWGRLAAWLCPLHRARHRLDRYGEPPGLALLRRALTTVFALALAAAAPLNARLMRSAARQRYTEYARDAAAFIQGRNWLLLEDREDTIVSVALHEAGHRVRTIQPALDGDPAYGRRLAEGFNDVRLRDCARLGIGALLNEWLNREPQGGVELAVLGFPDPWLAAGRRAVPDGPLVRGASQGPIPGLEAVARRNLEFARTYEGLVERSEPWLMTAVWNARVATRVSRAANNTGALLEEEGMPDLAAEAYAAALRVHPQNLSALMNLALLHGTQGREPPPDVVARIEAVAASLQRTGGRLDAWSLIRAFGEIRRPDVYARRGMAWALAGHAAAAQADWRRAGESGSPMRLLLAETHLRAGRADEGEAELLSLAEDTGDADVWLTAARAALQRKDAAEAARRLDRAAAAGAPAGAVALERARLDWIGGRREEAFRAVRALLRRDSDDLSAWALLAAFAAEAGDSGERDRAVERLYAARASLPPALLLGLARLEILRGGLARAREALVLARRAAPREMAPLELLLRLDVAEARREDALDRVREILAVAPSHAFANHVLGSIRLHEGNLVAAENALRRSLETERSAGALNDLANVLIRRGRAVEAVALAREAVELEPNAASHWDTLAEALMARQRPDDAEAAQRRAVRLAPEDSNYARRLEKIREAIKRSAKKEPPASEARGPAEAGRDPVRE